MARNATFGLCEFARTPQVERRPGNALNVELGTPQTRCTLRPPDGHGVTRDGSTLDYLRSGGSLLAYGLCDCTDAARCPRRDAEDASGQGAGLDAGHGQQATGHSPSSTGHGPRATGHSPSPDHDGLATRCPECGRECADFEGLAEHCAERPACRARVRELLAAAEMGFRICPRCDCAILGAVALADGVWIHQSCLTEAEREERGIEDAVTQAMVYSMRRAGRMPAPSKPEEVLP